MNEYQEKVKELLMPGFNEKQIFLPGGLEELARLYQKSDKERKPLRVKLGIDPTSCDLHLGHTVCLHMLKRFQKHGHKPVLIIGGFTAMVGDPSGRSEARIPLTFEEVKKNQATYLLQVRKILDIEKMEVRNNYDWLSKLSSKELIELSHIVTVNKLISKEAFGLRVEKGDPLYLHEVLYPILQGYDSVAVDADIEIGGTDQMFNLLFGRDVQKYFNKEPQFVILNPLLVGLDGKRKMSKTFNNYVALNDPPGEIFGKTMSIPDDLILGYLNLTDTSYEEIEDFKKKLASGFNPRDLKLELASRLVKLLYNNKDAIEAKENFIKQFQKKEFPNDIAEYCLEKPMKVTDLMLRSNLVPSKAEAKRLIKGGGVKLMSDRVNDPNYLITEAHRNLVLQVGSRKFIKIV